jgi:glutamate 5-kinase
MGSDRHGAGGKDIVLKVPLGTQIFDEDRETLIHDFTKSAEVRAGDRRQWRLRQRAFQVIDQPRAAQRQSGPARRGTLDLAAAETDRRRGPRRFAQCRQVDIPVGGQRSKTEDRRLSFTTLHPQLGVVRTDGREFVLADIPGLIEGAHEGAGLGDRFLGHVERCRVLLHLVDATSEHAGKDYKTIRAELEAYDPELAEKTEIVALSKIDAVSPEHLKDQKARLKRAAKKTPLLVSSVSHDGVPEALRALLSLIGEAPVSANAKKAAEIATGCRAGTAIGLVTAQPLNLSSAFHQDHFALIQCRIPRSKFPTHRRQGRIVAADRSAAGEVRASWLAALAADIAKLHKAGKDVLVVSSGSIALGRSRLKLPSGTLKLEEPGCRRCRPDRTGAHLVRRARRPWHRRGTDLVTLQDTEERRRYLNARSTIAKLLEWRAVPVINENDTVATNEIRYGDNDRLAARVATMTSSDLLILLSDINGLYTAPPSANPNAKLIPVVEAVTADIEAMAGAAESELSRGGMRTKIEAAKIATSAGTHMLIASGKIEHPLQAIADGGLHLVSHARQSRHRAQAMDCRLAGAEGHTHHRRGRCRSAPRRQKPAACRCDPGGRSFRARRRRDRARA